MTKEIIVLYVIVGWTIGSFMIQVIKRSLDWREATVDSITGASAIGTYWLVLYLNSVC